MLKKLKSLTFCSNKGSRAPILYFFLQAVFLVGVILTCDRIREFSVASCILWGFTVLTVVVYEVLHLKNPGYVPYDGVFFTEEEQKEGKKDATTVRIIHHHHRNSSVSDSRVRLALPFHASRPHHPSIGSMDWESGHMLRQHQSLHNKLSELEIRNMPSPQKYSPQAIENPPQMLREYYPQDIITSKENPAIISSNLEIRLDEKELSCQASFESPEGHASLDDKMYALESEASEGPGKMIVIGSSPSKMQSPPPNGLFTPSQLKDYIFKSLKKDRQAKFAVTDKKTFMEVPSNDHELDAQLEGKAVYYNSWPPKNRSPLKELLQYENCIEGEGTENRGVNQNERILKFKHEYPAIAEFSSSEQSVRDSVKQSLPSRLSAGGLVLQITSNQHLDEDPAQEERPQAGEAHASIEDEICKPEGQNYSVKLQNQQSKFDLCDTNAPSTFKDSALSTGVISADNKSSSTERADEKPEKPEKPDSEPSHVPKDVDLETGNKNCDFVVERRYCTVCNIEQPIRAKHCKSCARCVASYDHHCPWIGNCVGEKNHPLFLGFLSLQLLQIGAYVNELLANYFYSEGNENVIKGVFRGFEIFLLAVIFLLIGALGVCHIFLASKNLTTWEFMSWKKISYLKDWPRSQGSPFSRGVLKNLKYFFCESKKDLRKWRFPKKVVGAV